LRLFYLLIALSVVKFVGAQTNYQRIEIKNIQIKGNKRTKDHIILRELTFKQGDTITNVDFHQEQSRKQLLNLYLFNEVKVEIDSQNAIVNIIERWYIWPSPKLDYADRNLNQWLLTKDPSRLIYGVDLELYNFRGRNETVKFNFRGGYTKLLSLNYVVPYFNKRLTWGLTFNAVTSSNKEVWYKTDSNKVQFFKDNDRDLIRRKSAELGFVHRKKIFNYHRIYTGFRQINVKDTVVSVDVNERYLFGKMTTQNEWYTGYLYTSDKRDFKGYPLQGSLLKMTTEIGLFNATEFSGQFKLSYARYFKLNKRFFNANSLTMRLMEFYSVPYNKITALGYDRDYIRGYELYVIDGLNFGLGKSEFKYCFFNKKLPFLKGVNNYNHMPLALYLTSFVDYGVVITSSSRISSNTYPNKFQYGFGSGLNVVAFYDYVMRIEYSFDKFLNNRFYLSFITAI
jgi:outer membrane protein assembly factor BamA